MMRAPQLLGVQNLQRPHPFFGNFRQWAQPFFSILLIALVYFYRIDRPLLWDDEAETGVVARNILRTGYPTASDGRNVTLYDNGAELNGNLVFKRIPWIQYYLGALSLLVFGNNTAGLRVLFVFSGILAFFPIYAILRPRLKYPSFLTALTLLSPQIILLQRNARYYPILVLLYSVLVWHLLKKFKNPWSHFLLASLIFVLFFHAHPLAAMCSALSLIAFCLLFRREDLVSYFFAFAVGFASWFIWYEFLGPTLAEPEFAISLISTNFGIWFKMFCDGLWATLVDMDVVDCLPLLIWMALPAILLARSRPVLRSFFREPLFAFVFLNILIQGVACAALFGVESSAKYSMLRYQPHLLVFGLVATFMIIDAVITVKSLSLCVSLFAVGFNFLTISFWTKPLSRHVPASWLFPVYSEIFRPRQNAWDLAISRLENEPKHDSGNDIVMLPLPPWTREIAIFYLGDRYLVRPILHKPAGPCEQALRANMGERASGSLFAQPEWILNFQAASKTIPAGYDLAEVIPSYLTDPVDGSRPELTHHAFPQAEIAGNVRLLRLQKK
jgi:hypothetical protein